jgi:chemotaxis protein methyltransferase CheR
MPIENIESLVLSPDTFQLYVNYIKDVTGISIGSNRINMVHGRFHKRIQELNLSSFESYLNYVKQDASEKSTFIDLITTNETQFFRTPRIWTYLIEVFLPRWHLENPKKIFMAWSAAASSGEEAHSLGIICQQFKEKHPDFTYQIVGTDISKEMVQLCQVGNYGDKSVNSFKKLRPENFVKFMRKISEEKYQTIEEIKSRIRFQQHNLFKPFAAKESFDLILLRNVLIYFVPADQEKVLSLIEINLSKNGMLIIGESESLTHIKSAFQYVEPLVYKKAIQDQAA